jgi:hypothetical protein
MPRQPTWNSVRRLKKKEPRLVTPGLSGDLRGLGAKRH